MLCSKAHLLLISNRDGIDLLVLVRNFGGGVDWDNCDRGRGGGSGDDDGGDGDEDGEAVGFHVVDASNEDDNLFFPSLLCFSLPLLLILFSTV